MSWIDRVKDDVVRWMDSGNRALITDGTPKQAAAAAYVDALLDTPGQVPAGQLPKRFQCGVCGRWFKTQRWHERDALGPLAQHVFYQHCLDEAPILTDKGERRLIRRVATVDERGHVTELLPNPSTKAAER